MGLPSWRAEPIGNALGPEAKARSRRPLGPQRAPGAGAFGQSGEAEALSRRWRVRSGSLAGRFSGGGRPPNPAQQFIIPEAAPARRRRSACWPSEGEARPAGAILALEGEGRHGTPCPWLASACSALSPGAVGLSGQTPNFGFRIPDFKIENSVFESGVSSPVPGHARIRMRVSVCAYPGARAGERNPAAPRAPVLTGGFSVWLALAYGACSMAFCSLAPGAQRRGQRPGAMADSALGRPDRAGRGRGRRRSGAAEFRRGRVRSTLIPPGCPPVAADLRGASTLAAAPMLVLAKAPGRDPPQRDRTGRPGLLCHIGSSLAQSHCAPGANGPRFCALAFRLWRIALAPPPLPSPPLPPFLFL